MNHHRTSLLLANVAIRSRCKDAARSIISQINHGATEDDVAILLEQHILDNEWPAVLRYIETVMPKQKKEPNQ